MTSYSYFSGDCQDQGPGQSPKLKVLPYKTTSPVRKFQGLSGIVSDGQGWSGIIREVQGKR